MLKGMLPAEETQKYWFSFVYCLLLLLLLLLLLQVRPENNIIIIS